MKRILYILAFVAGIVIVAAVVQYAGKFAGRYEFVRPADYVVPSHKRDYDDRAKKAKLAPAADMDFLRSIEPEEFTDEEILFKLDENDVKESAHSHEVGYEVVELDLEKLDKSEPYVRPLAVGAAHHEVPDKDAVLSEGNDDGGNVSYTYFDIGGEQLSEEQLEGIKGVRDRKWINSDRYSFQVVYEVNNLESPRQVGSWLYDRNTYASLTNGSSWSYREGNPYEISYGVNTYHPAELRWVVDIAYGPCEHIDIPLEEDSEAEFGEAAFRLITDPFEAYSNSSSWSGGNIKYRFSESDRKHQNVVVGISPKCMIRLFTVQFLDGNKNAIGSEISVYSNSHVNLVENYSKERGEYLRIYRYSGIKRFVLDIGSMPGTPEVNDGVENLMEVKIPYVYAGRAGDVEDIIGGAIQLNVYSSLGYTDILPERRYYNVTPLELLEEMKKVSPPGVDIDMRLEQGSVAVDKLHGKDTVWQKIKNWFRKIF